MEISHKKKNTVAGCSHSTMHQNAKRNGSVSGGKRVTDESAGGYSNTGPGKISQPGPLMTPLQQTSLHQQTFRCSDLMD